MKVTVVGFGRSGVSAVKLLHDKGAEVTVTDCRAEEDLKEEIRKLNGRNVKLQLGEGGVSAVEGAEMVVVSPGVPPDTSAVQLAERKKIRIISEIELFSWFCNSPIIAITGTNGKTTTTLLSANLLNNLGYKVTACGNIGVPLTELVDKEALVVAEISSFQLERIEKFRPYISVILNITPDHLDRYRDFQDYVSAKSRIFENQKPSDFTVLNADDSVVSKFSERTKANIVLFSRKKILEEGVFLSSGRIMARWKGEEKEICSTGDIKMKGAHNLENCLAAAAIGLIYDAGIEVIKNTILEFSGLEHRIEYVRTVGGVDFFNDSKATNAAAVAGALESFTSPIVLICGGRDKRSDYTALGVILQDRVKLVVLFGESKKKLMDAFSGIVSCVCADSFSSAFRLAAAGADSGDVVLLSPACSSFDMFRDFEERGEIFKAEVENFYKET